MASQGTSSTSPEARRATPAARPPPEQGLRCPRCDSSNTKFCYYNNYSLTQPRHFCKTCRRYWTKGGALRNVPVGGGGRKNKKTKASATTFAITGGMIRPNFLIPDHHKSSPVDQLFPFSKLDSSSTNISTSAGHAYNQFLTFGDLSPSSMACDNNIVASSCASSHESGGAIAQHPIMGFKPFDPISSPAIGQVGITNSGVYAGGRIQEIGSADNMQTHDIASSIESLSSMNQDLHFKLQQQRFAMLLGGGSPRETPANSTSLIENQPIHQLPISFHASGSSKNGGNYGVEVGDKVQVATDHNTTKLFLESSYPTASEIQSWSGMRQFS